MKEMLFGRFGNKMILNNNIEFKVLKELKRKIDDRVFEQMSHFNEMIELCLEKNKERDNHE